MEDFRILIAKMQEKQPTPTQNVQRVKVELRNIDPSVKVITRSEMVTQGAMEATAKDIMPSQEGAHISKEPKTIATAAQMPTHLKMEEPFLQACLKLLRNP